MSDRPRRVIAGRKALSVFIGIKESRQRELEALDPSFPQHFKLTGARGRAIGWWEDEVCEWQRLRAEQCVAPKTEPWRSWPPSKEQLTGEVRQFKPEPNGQRNRPQARRR
jgi:predicted DNA-binding transcriptional regulator AlpA